MRERLRMMDQCNRVKNLFLVGLITMIVVLITPVVSAGVFFPTPYSMEQFPGQYSAGSDSVIGFGALLTPGVVEPAYIPQASAATVTDYPTGMLYPMNSVIIHPAIMQFGSTQQPPGAYYNGSGAGSGIRSSGGGYMCSF